MNGSRHPEQQISERFRCLDRRVAGEPAATGRLSRVDAGADDGDTTRFARGKLNEFAADRVQPCALARGVPVGALCELDAVAGIR